MGEKSENCSKKVPDPNSWGSDLSKDIKYAGVKFFLIFNTVYDTSTRSTGENGPKIWKLLQKGSQTLNLEVKTFPKIYNMLGVKQFDLTYSFDSGTRSTGANRLEIQK